MWLGDFTVVISSATTYTEPNDDTKITTFNTGGRGARPEFKALLFVDYNWDAAGSDKAHLIINDHRVATLTATDPHFATRQFAFLTSWLSSAEGAANRFRVDIDSPGNPGRTFTINSATVFFNQNK